MKRWVCAVAMAAAIGGGAAGQMTSGGSAGPDGKMNELAERYVKLVLAVGQHDADYVDAFYGPPEWRKEAEATKLPLGEIARRAEETLAQLESVSPPADRLLQLRHDYLTRQLQSLVSRVQMLGGKRLSFDEESKALYDAVSPQHPTSYFQETLDALDRLLPGEGPLLHRYDEFRKAFIIPSDKLDAIFTAAIKACAERTRRHIDLPEGESFKVEYVTGKSWSGYNWYQGNFHSLIQVNTDLPIYIDRAIDLACHEGYPGHHVYNVLLEKELVRERGWQEFTVYALFSPQSLIAEGSANYGIEMAFPGDERAAFEAKTLFPLAGLDPATATKYYEIHEQLERLTYAGNEAARRYLNGEITAEQAAAWLEQYALMAPARAAQRVKFMDQYRSYVINYNLGKDLVRQYVESNAQTPEARWETFEALLSSPMLPSKLQ